MSMQPWAALWAINDIPNDGFEVIRDGRPVGIPRCEDFDGAVEEILRHDLYQRWDRVVCRWGHHECDVDLARYQRELVGT